MPGPPLKGEHHLPERLYQILSMRCQSDDRMTVGYVDPAGNRSEPTKLSAKNVLHQDSAAHTQIVRMVTACKISGLKDARARLRTVHFPVLYRFCFQCYAF